MRHPVGFDLLHRDTDATLRRFILLSFYFFFSFFSGVHFAVSGGHTAVMFGRCQQSRGADAVSRAIEPPHRISHPVAGQMLPPHTRGKGMPHLWHTSTGLSFPNWFQYQWMDGWIKRWLGFLRRCVFETILACRQPLRWAVSFVLISISILWTWSPLSVVSLGNWMASSSLPGGQFSAAGLAGAAVVCLSPPCWHFSVFAFHYIDWFSSLTVWFVGARWGHDG